MCRVLCESVPFDRKISWPASLVSGVVAKAGPWLSSDMTLAILVGRPPLPRLERGKLDGFPNEASVAIEASDEFRMGMGGIGAVFCCERHCAMSKPLGSSFDDLALGFEYRSGGRVTADWLNVRRDM